MSIMRKSGWEFDLGPPTFSNGNWGMPILCYKIDKLVFPNKAEHQGKYSALCVAFDKTHGEDFEIKFSHPDGFFISSSNHFICLPYDYYELENNILRCK